MMLRPRVAVTSLLVALPAALAVAYAIDRTRAHDMEVALDRVVRSQLNAQVKERCVSDPTWFLTGPLIGRPPNGIFIDPNPDALAPRPRPSPQPFELFAYDEEFLASSGAAPRFPQDFRRAMRASPDAAFAPHVTAEGSGVQMAIATGWKGTPCAYFVGRMAAQPHQSRDRMLFAFGLLALCFIVALGATAARSVLGRPTTIGKARGQPLQLDDGATAFVTVHPSALLRIKDEADKRRQYQLFVDDLRLASKAIQGP